MESLNELANEIDWLPMLVNETDGLPEWSDSKGCRKFFNYTHHGIPLFLRLEKVSS